MYDFIKSVLTASWNSAHNICKTYLKFLSAGFIQCTTKVLVIPETIPVTSIKSSYYELAWTARLLSGTFLSD